MTNHAHQKNLPIFHLPFKKAGNFLKITSPGDSTQFPLTHYHLSIPNTWPPISASCGGAIELTTGALATLHCLVRTCQTAGIFILHSSLIYHMSLRGISFHPQFWGHFKKNTCFCMQNPPPQKPPVWFPLTGLPYKGPEVLGVSVIMRRTTTSGAPEVWSLKRESLEVGGKFEDSYPKVNFQTSHRSRELEIISFFLSILKTTFSWYPDFFLEWKVKYLGNVHP